MIHVMRAIYSMVDGNVSEAIRGSTMEKVIAGSRRQSQSTDVRCLLQAEKHAEKLFMLIDLDGDGKLTSKEFLRVGLVVWSDV